MSKKLNQILAIEKGVKTRVYSEVTELHKISQKPDNFNGFSKTYRKKDEEGEDLPADRKKVQVESKDQLARVAALLTEIFDVTATKDYANCDAKADVVIDGQTIIAQAPATLLLFLEKQLTDYHTYVSKLPTLDENEDWLADPNSGLFKTPSIETHRTKKVQKPLVLYPATEQHPAQTQLVTEDVIAGYWDTVKQSGALPVPRKRELLDRTEKLLQAVKTAREEANMAEAPEKQIGAALFAYLLK